MKSDSCQLTHGHKRCYRKAFLNSDCLNAVSYFDKVLSWLVQYFATPILTPTAQSGVLGLQVSSGDPHQLYVTWQPDPCTSSFEVTHQCQDIPLRITNTSRHFFTGLESSSNLPVYVRPIYGDVTGPDASFPPPTSKLRAFSK